MRSQQHDLVRQAIAGNLCHDVGRLERWSDLIGHFQPDPHALALFKQPRDSQAVLASYQRRWNRIQFCREVVDVPVEELPRAGRNDQHGERANLGGLADGHHRIALGQPQAVQRGGLLQFHKDDLAAQALACLENRPALAAPC